MSCAKIWNVWHVIIDLTDSLCLDIGLLQTEYVYISYIKISTCVCGLQLT